jgi:hypothetical protein
MHRSCVVKTPSEEYRGGRAKGAWREAGVKGHFLAAGRARSMLWSRRTAVAATTVLAASVRASPSLRCENHEHYGPDSQCAAMDAVLDSLFDGLADGHEIPISDHHEIDASGGHEAYGELTTLGFRQLGKYFHPRADDVFCDLGSGRGRAVLQAALEWPVASAVGIELSASRDAVAQAALRRAEPLLRKPARLERADMLACEGSCRDATIVYVASLLFDDDFMFRLGQFLSQSMPDLRSIASLRRFPPGSLPGFVEDERNDVPDEVALRDRLECCVEVTWGAARVFLYERRAESRSDS